MKNEHEVANETSVSCTIFWIFVSELMEACEWNILRYVWKGMFLKAHPISKVSMHVHIFDGNK